MVGVSLKHHEPSIRELLQNAQEFWYVFKRDTDAKLATLNENFTIAEITWKFNSSRIEALELELKNLKVKAEEQNLEITKMGTFKTDLQNLNLSVLSVSENVKILTDKVSGVVTKQERLSVVTRYGEKLLLIVMSAVITVLISKYIKGQ